MRFFQKRIESGKPSRSRGPGRSSKKKSASSASKDRSPFGMILIGGFVEKSDGVTTDTGCSDLVDVGISFTTSSQASRSSRRSSVVLYRSVRRLERHFRQIRSNSHGTC